MTTEFEVGDDIWWLDCRGNYKPKIRLNSVLDIVKEACGGTGYLIINETYIWSPSTVIAKTKEGLINILYPTKIGPFDYNQLVYVIKNTGGNSNYLITKAYVKGQTIFISEYNLSCIKDSESNTFGANISDIYSTIDLAIQTVETWLNNNDN